MMTGSYSRYDSHACAQTFREDSQPQNGSTSAHVQRKSQHLARTERLTIIPSAPLFLLHHISVAVVDVAFLLRYSQILNAIPTAGSEQLTTQRQPTRRRYTIPTRNAAHKAE